ncbi:glycosyltransferase [Lysinibacillus sp. TE18511]
MNYALNLKENYSTFRRTKTDNDPKDYAVNKTKYTSMLAKTTALVVPFTLTPILVSADTFGDIHNTVMSIFDGGVVLVIIFAGASWALGHRSKAIELLIGVCCGYLLARHAIDIRDYLKSIG